MASLLYRAGTGHFENGVECEMISVEYDQYEAMLSAGWSTSPPGATAAEESKELSEADKVREAARLAGIDGWDTKRINTLRGLLEG